MLASAASSSKMGKPASLCRATAFRLRPSRSSLLHDSSRSYVHHSFPFLSASVAAISGHQLFGHRCRVAYWAGSSASSAFCRRRQPFGDYCLAAVSAMMVMADAYGADGRLVAFMQYCACHRHGCHQQLPSFARLWVHTAPAIASAAPAIWFGRRFTPCLFSKRAGSRSCSGYSGRPYFPHSRAGILLRPPMFLGAVLQSATVLSKSNCTSPGCCAVSYLLLGWTIGLRFTREILVLYAIRALPKMIVSILILIAFCGGLAFALVEVFDVFIDRFDGLSCHQPGQGRPRSPLLRRPPMSMCSRSFTIMAQQIARFMLVLIVGPALSRFVADQIARNVPNISDTTPT